MDNELKANEYRKKLKDLNDIKINLDKIDKWRIQYNIKKLDKYIDKLLEKYNLTFIEDTFEYIDECDYSMEQKYVVSFEVIQNGKKFTSSKKGSIIREFEKEINKILLPHYRDTCGIWVTIYFN